MSIEKVPFVRYKTDEEKALEESRIVSIRLNNADIQILNNLRELFDIDSERTMLRVALHNYHYVLHRQFSPEFIRYLFKSKRDRLSENSGIPNIDSAQNVVQDFSKK